MTPSSCLESILPGSILLFTDDIDRIMEWALAVKEHNVDPRQTIVVTQSENAKQIIEATIEKACLTMIVATICVTEDSNIPLLAQVIGSVAYLECENPHQWTNFLDALYLTPTVQVDPDSLKSSLPIPETNPEITAKEVSLFTKLDWQGKYSDWSLNERFQVCQAIQECLSIHKSPTVVVLGSRHGQIEHLIQAVCEQASREHLLITIDQHPSHNLRKQVENDPNAQLIEGYPHRVIEQCKKIVTKGIDFLVIDGDWMASAVGINWMKYNELLNPNAKVVFHHVYPKSLDEYPLFNYRYKESHQPGVAKVIQEKVSVNCKPCHYPVLYPDDMSPPEGCMPVFKNLNTTVDIYEPVSTDQARLFTVIIPTYNRAKNLPKAIESILGQTYSNWELIIVNDGSTDNTEEVVRTYLSDPRITTIITKNQKVAKARNDGMDLAKGEYVCFCDDDDTYFATTLETYNEQINKHPKMELLYGNTYWEKGKDSVPSHGPDEISYGSGISPSTMCFKNNKTYRFPEDIHFLEDWYFFMDLQHRGVPMGHFEKSVLNVTGSSDDQLTSINDMKEGYQEIAARFYRDKLAPTPEWLVLVRPDEEHINALFFHFNQCRLFFPTAFEYCIDLSDHSESSSQMDEYCKKMNWPVVRTKKEREKLIQSSDTPTVAEFPVSVVPLKGMKLRVPKVGGKESLRAKALIDPSQVTAFNTMWKPRMMIIESYEAEIQTEDTDTVTTYLKSELSSTVVSESIINALWTPNPIQSIFIAEEEKWV
jgi:glycosyltransferase involved in cell wall biosynthesis